jgi:hypothetical protein
VERDACSLYIFEHSSWLRIFVVSLVEQWYFDQFIMLIIIANSILMCLDDKDDRIMGDDYWSPRNYILNQIDMVFSVIFIAECTCKIIALGFIFHKHSYLRDGWNRLDFIVVIISILNFLP